MHQPYLYRHGAHPDGDGFTRFSLWAPDADSVAVKLTDGTTHALPAGEHGWYSARLPVPVGRGYSYLINGELEVPDPASRAQQDDVHSPCLVVDHSAYSWQHPQWQGRPWHETVLYELHVGLLGGYRAVEEKLPALAELGITAIELMPLGEFPGARNWGYDGVLPFAPDSSYGSPDDLKHLIDTAHGLGLMVFVDVVYNHFGPDGNYLGQYAREFFREDLHTPWGAAIDFRRTEVRDYFCENALMWILDYRIDGLRLDAVHAIKDPDFLLELAGRVRSVSGDRQVHLVLENEDNRASLLQTQLPDPAAPVTGFNAQWNDDGHNILHTLLTGESEGYYADYIQSQTAKLARCLGEGFIYQGEISHRGHSRGEPSNHLPPTAFVLFLQNHDQVGNRAMGERLMSLTDLDSLAVATAILLLSPMIPLLFMGEEWGSQQPFQYFTDHNPELAEAVRNGRRNEFAAFSHFSDAKVRARIPDPNAETTFNTSKPDYALRESEATEQWLDLYRTLLSLRHQHIIPRLAGASNVNVRMFAARAVSACWRMGDGSLLRFDINLAHTRVKFHPRTGGDQLLFSHGFNPDATTDDTSYDSLPPRSIVITLAHNQ